MAIELKLIEKCLTDNTVSKEEIEAQANDIVACVEKGERTALDLRYELKVLSEVINAAIDKLVDQSVNESMNYGTNFIYRNVNIKVQETGIKYDYTSCPRWNQLKQQEDVIANNRKVVEDCMKKTGYIDEETGEISKAKKTSKTNLVFSFMSKFNKK